MPIDMFPVDGSHTVVMGHISGTVRMSEKSFDGPFARHLPVVQRPDHPTPSCSTAC
ncbi:hypothetical protein [Brucella pituitosa]|uniref:hypothetical protein n=1 Tax=Brucella pituitosa TaxID=571256 RepID=UPI00137474FE|nr:hypothetical protein [Brucella pituitosa]